MLEAAHEPPLGFIRVASGCPSCLGGSDSDHVPGIRVRLGCTGAQTASPGRSLTPLPNSLSGLEQLPAFQIRFAAVSDREADFGLCGSKAGSHGEALGRVCIMETKMR